MPQTNFAVRYLEKHPDAITSRADLKPVKMGGCRGGRTPEVQRALALKEFRRDPHTDRHFYAVAATDMGWDAEQWPDEFLLVGEQPRGRMLLTPPSQAKLGKDTTPKNQAEWDAMLARIEVNKRAYDKYIKSTKRMAEMMHFICAMKDYSRKGGKVYIYQGVHTTLHILDL